VASAQSSASITATDQTVVGTPTAVTIEPELTVTWDGFDETATGVRIFVQARTAGADDYQTVIDESVAVEPATAGQRLVTLPRTDLLDTITVTSSTTVELRYVVVFEHGEGVVMSSATVDTPADALAIDAASVVVETTAFDLAVEEPTTTTVVPK
jgi:hypothetical protein